MFNINKELLHPQSEHILYNKINYSKPLSKYKLKFDDFIDKDFEKTYTNSTKFIQEDVDFQIENTGVNKFVPLSKSDYYNISKNRRRREIHRLFEDELIEIFNKMEDQALQLRDCHFEVSFNIQYIDNEDMDLIEELLRDYFIDLGYNVVVADRTYEDIDQIILTLT